MHLLHRNRSILTTRPTQTLAHHTHNEPTPMYLARWVRPSGTYLPGSPTHPHPRTYCNQYPSNLINKSPLSFDYAKLLISFFTSPSLSFLSLPGFVVPASSLDPSRNISSYLVLSSFTIAPYLPYLLLPFFEYTSAATQYSLYNFYKFNLIHRHLPPGSQCAALASFIFMNPYRAAPCYLFPPSSVLSCGHPNEQRYRF
ncbi:hypothetical protein LY78DRAFT_67756 [Colletotrichum sublineola]|nr:hypothetical protein LY78DRAFT_67756 [Colletotrichum sublineola]